MQNLKFTPNQDPLIHNYDINSLKEKSKNKAEIQKMFNLKPDLKTFLVSITSEFTNSSYGNIYTSVLEGLLNIGVQVLVRGKGTKKYQQQIENLQNSYSQSLAVFEDIDENIRRVYAATDANIFLKINNNSLKDLEMCMRYGNIPISIQHQGLVDFDPLKETGNCFLIEKISPWNIFESVIRAKENFKFAYDWQNIQKTCMQTDLN